ncbi:MAG: flavodoxin [Methanosphaera sp. rholeuAM130]|nr:flavodoxin family protein [Methanosphaera sp.]RAP54487.1 MAG: flavodoxin [Methanosphaera sp. rholeuAM130]
MKYAIRYYSKTGNTKSLAQAISEVLNVKAHDITVEPDEDVDILFLGTSIYGSSIDPSVIKFFDELKVNVKKIISFGTSGTMQSQSQQIANLCLVHDIELDENEFHCPGEFVGMNKNRPNSQDIEDVKEFVRNVIKRA